MVVRENWDVKWIQWFDVQEEWVVKVSLADTLNIVWGTVTDVNWVATITIPEHAKLYFETVAAWSATYTLQHTPLSNTSFMVMVDSGIMLFPTEDYTYLNWVITFLSLWANEKAYVYVLSAD